MHPIYNVSIETKILQFFHGLLDAKFPFGREKSSAVLHCLISSLPFLI
jgi:hypothetical protein